MKTEQLWLRIFANLPEQTDVVEMRMKLGWEGFGIYVGILCLLRGSQDGTLPTSYNKIGWQLHCPNDKVKSVITEFGLFTLTEDGKRFFNQALTDEMKQYQSRLDERREAGRRSAERRWRPKADRNSNGDAISAPGQTTENIANVIGNPSDFVTEATDSDAINKYNKQTYNTSCSINQSAKPISLGEGTPGGVGLPKKKIEEDFFSQFDDRWKAIFERWYAHRKRLSPKLRNISVITDNFKYLLELSGGDISYAEAIVDFSIKQSYSGLYPPSQGKSGGRGARASVRPEVKYSNDAWKDSDKNLPKGDISFDENGNPCPF